MVGGERFGRYSFIGLPARTLLRASGFRTDVVTDGAWRCVLFNAILRAPDDNGAGGGEMAVPELESSYVSAMCAMFVLDEYRMFALGPRCAPLSPVPMPAEPAVVSECVVTGI